MPAMLYRRNCDAQTARPTPTLRTAVTQVTPEGPDRVDLGAESYTFRSGGESR